MTRVILGCWDFAIAESMLLALRREGILVEDLYCFLYYRLPWENNDVLNARELASRHGGIKRIWLDCEAMFDGPAGLLDTEAEGTTVSDRITITAKYSAELKAEFEAGIYTGTYWWRSKMGNSQLFNDLPLWLASYGSNDPDKPRDQIYFVDFGGWSDVAVHQYSSTIPVCGRERDHNYWFLEEDDDMALSEEVAQLRKEVDLLKRIVGANGIAKDPAGYVASGRDPKLLTTGADALAYADERGWSAFLGLALNQVETQAAKTSGGIAPGTKFSVEVIE